MPWTEDEMVSLGEELRHIKEARHHVRQAIIEATKRRLVRTDIDDYNITLSRLDSRHSILVERLKVPNE